MTTEELPNFNTNTKKTKIVKDFLQHGSIINLNGSFSQEIRRRLRIERIGIKKLEKILNSKDVPLEAKEKITNTTIFLIFPYGYVSKIQMRDDKKK